MTIPWIIVFVVVYAVIGWIVGYMVAFMTMDTHEPTDLAPAAGLFWPILLGALLIWLIAMLFWTLIRSMWLWARILTRRSG